MKIAKKINNRNKILLISVVVLLMIAGGSALYVLSFGGNIFGWSINKEKSVSNDGSINEPTDTPPLTDPATTEQVNDGAAIKKSTIDNSNLDADSNKDSINISATYSQDSSYLKISTIIQTITSTGNCSLILSKGSTVIDKQVDVQALPSYSTCKGFSIPIDTLSSGVWKAAVNFTDGPISASTSIDITIK